MIEINNNLFEDINPFKQSDIDIEKLHKLYLVIQKDKYSTLFDSVSRYLKKVKGNVDLIKFVQFRNRQMAKFCGDRKQFDFLFDLAVNKWFLDNNMRHKVNESLTNTNMYQK